MSRPRSVVVTFITRNNCPLCEKGWEILSSVAARYRVEVVARDVDTDESLFKQFSDRVPVVATVDGSIVDEGNLSESRLSSGLAALIVPRSPLP